MQTACSCNAKTANYQPPATTNSNLQTNKNTANFSTGQSLTGNEESDQLITGLLSILVQLLIQQFGGGQQQPTDQNNHSAPELDFNDTDKQHLLSALDTKTTANTQIGTISDSDASNHLNQGDGVELLNQGTSENHEITDAEVGRFINLRNPPGTPQLTLTDQQNQQIASQFNLSDISIADNNGDGRISEGDHISGTQTSGGQKLDVDRLVTTELANHLAG